MVSNITALSSHLFVAGIRLSEPSAILRTARFFLKEVLSRKKQLMPYLIELVERFS